MNDSDVIDRAWRDGLAELADLGSPEGLPARIEARRHARVVRRRATFSGVVALVCLAATAGALGVVAARDGGRTNAAAGGRGARSDAIATIHIEVLVGFQLRAVLKNAGDFPPVTFAENGEAVMPLPRPGLYRFVFSGASGHREALDGHFIETHAGHEVVMAVRLAAGRYDLKCTVAGHAEAGERLGILVSP